MNKTKLGVFCLIIVAIMCQTGIDAKRDYENSTNDVQKAQSKKLRTRRGNGNKDAQVQQNAEQKPSRRQNPGTPCRGNGCNMKNIERPGYFKKTVTQ